MLRKQEHRGFEKAGQLSGLQSAAAAPDLFTGFASDELEILCKKMRLSPKYLSQGHLTIPLHRDFSRVRPELISAVEKTPSLKNHISFLDKNEVREYKDVVFDLMERPLELARALYTGDPGKKYIVVTPHTQNSIVGDKENIHCSPQTVKGRKGPVSLQVIIATDGYSWDGDRKRAGNRHIIQSDNITLVQRSNGDWSDMVMYIHTRPAMASEYHEKVALRPATALTHGL